MFCLISIYLFIVNKKEVPFTTQIKQSFTRSLTASTSQQELACSMWSIMVDPTMFSKVTCYLNVVFKDLASKYHLSYPKKDSSLKKQWKYSYGSISRKIFYWYSPANLWTISTGFTQKGEFYWWIIYFLNFWKYYKL